MRQLLTQKAKKGYTKFLLIALAGVLFSHITYDVNARDKYMPGCDSRACEKRVLRKATKKQLRQWCKADCQVRVYKKKWVRRFKALSAEDQTWARRISTCESGNRRIAREGGFWSYFQWTLGTWHAAGGSGNPENVYWHEQAVRAVRFMRANGTHHWPACSQKLGYM